MFKDYFLIVTRSLKRRQLRSWLTIIGILIGIATVIALVSLGQGLENYVNEQFEQMGADKILILPSGGFAGVSLGNKFSKDDLEAVNKVRGVKLAGGMIYQSKQIKFNGETKDTFIMGFPQDETKEIFESMGQFEVYKGRDLDKDDQKSVIIGIAYQEDNFFDRKVQLRDTLLIDDVEFKVVGIVERIGNPQDDSNLYISEEEARELFDEPEDSQQIMAQVAKGSDVNLVAKDIEEALRKSRNVEENEEDFSVQTSEQLMSSFSDILKIVQVVIIGIAAISLIVGGIGIMNTMYTSVMERTREIGIMKAIGAKNSDISLLFLIESGILGLIGGLIGLALGASISKLVEFGASQVGFGILKVSFSPLLIFGSLLFSFIAGALSGTMPAIQASKLKPVEALRYE